jgi:hypothetical protein
LAAFFFFTLPAIAKQSFARNDVPKCNKETKKRLQSGRKIVVRPLFYWFEHV